MRKLLILVLIGLVTYSGYPVFSMEDNDDEIKEINNINAEHNIENEMSVLNINKLIDGKNNNSNESNIIINNGNKILQDALDRIDNWCYNFINNNLALEVHVQVMTAKTEKELVDNIIKKMVQIINDKIKNRTYFKSMKNTVSDIKKSAVSYITSNYQPNISNHEMEKKFMDIYLDKEANKNSEHFEIFCPTWKYIIDIVHRNIYKVLANNITGKIKKLNKEANTIINNYNMIYDFLMDGYKEQLSAKQNKELDDYKLQAHDESEYYIFEEFDENSKLNRTITSMKNAQEIKLNKEMGLYEKNLHNQTEDKLKPINDEKLDFVYKYSNIENDNAYGQLPVDRRNLLQQAIMADINDKGKHVSYFNHIYNELCDIKQQIEGIQQETTKNNEIKKLKQQILEGYITNPYIINYIRQNYVV